MKKSAMVAIGLLLAAAGEAPCADVAPTDDRIAVPTRSVLTGNAEAGELSLDTGATYTAQPAFNEPADPDNRRLLDRDRPVVDSTKRAGINGPAQTVTFDLKRPYRVGEVALHFRFPQQPLSVAIAVAPGAAGPWKIVGALKAEEQRAEWWKFDIEAASGAAVPGRYVRLDFAGKPTGWNINEITISGVPAEAPQSTRRVRGKLALVADGRPHATIVLADRSRASTLQAAELFQSVTQRMTGAQLQIVPESRFDGKSAAVLIGDSELARKRGVAVEQTPFGDDRYVLRGGGKDDDFIALVGNDTLFGDPANQYGHYFRGSLFAVYDFFERQGCGWYGPSDLWQVVPQADSLLAPSLAVQEIPAFKWRRIWMSGLPPESPLRSAWRQGGTEIASWHNYSTLVPPDKHKAAHPEWFGDYQPDITHPEVIAVAVETLSQQMEARPNQPLMSFPVSANDGGGFKEKPFKDVGNIAAQQLYFANEIAKGLRAKHPGRRFTLGTLGYWYSHRGPEPMLKAEPEVVVSMVNEGNHTKPMEWPETAEVARITGRNNTRERNALGEWKKTGGLTGIYEWWIPAISNIAWQETPWYDGATAVANLRYWHANGIRYLDYESQKEINGGFPLRWAQYYIGARAAWNPGLDPRRELLAACRKLFGGAGETMAGFYGLQERAMRQTGELVGNWALPLPHLLYTPAIEAEGEALLVRALAKEKTGPEHTRIAIEMKQWMRLIEMNAAARAEQKKVYKVTMNGVSMNWNKQIIDAATVVDLADLPPGTPMEVLERDGQNRTALPGETYDLESGVTFRTLKPEKPR